MSKLRFVVPSEEMKDEIMEYKREFIESGDSIDGSAGLDKFDNFDNWLKEVKLNSCKDTVMDGLVQATTYLVLRNADGRLVGMVNIRHELNEILEKFGGHIGYSVRKSERRKGYAKEILRLALEECEKLSIRRVLVTCNKENIASMRTIIANGGILENEVQSDGIVYKAGKTIQRYWIDI